MGAIISSAACCAGEAACCVGCMCCSKVMSALCSCGSSKSSPSIGRKSSVALLMVSIVFSLALQYFIVPNTPVNENLDYAWHCGGLADSYQENCRATSAVLRVSAVTCGFFLIAATLAAVAPSMNRNFWGLKILVYLFLLLCSMFLPAAVFDSHGYLQVARVGGAVFVVLQQVILIDLAYTWNDTWVQRADEDERQEMGSGRAWLKALLFISGTILVLAYTSLGFLFDIFGGCDTNDTFLYLTLLLTLLAVAFQLTGDEGSLLTSAVMTGYAVFLCYSAVSNNPDSGCNPMLGQDNWLDRALGLSFIVASMGWTCFSYASSMTDMFAEGEDRAVSLIHEDPEAASNAGVKGVVAGGEKYGAAQMPEATASSEEKNSAGGAFSSVRDSMGAGDFDHSMAWKLNLVLALMSTWYPMVLTSWGTIKEDGTAANPSVGETGMWMVMCAQWVALAMYIWTLVAPRLFPDRDFS